MRAVRFDRFGGPEVLQVVDVDRPEAGAGQVLVAVRAAGINPGEAAIREGRFDPDNTKLPSGEGSDLAGVVETVGDGVTQWSPGDEVLGWCWERASHAEFVAVPASQLIAKPSGLSWAVAGGLYVVGVTAIAAVRAADPQAGETVVVSAAAGGVGNLVVQLLRRQGITVVGIASERNHPWLQEKGAIPVAYGDGLADRIRAVAPKVDAFIDTFGPDYLDLALELGVPPDRIETIIAFERAAQIGAKAEGSGDATTPEVLTDITSLVASGEVELEIAATFPLEEVRAAFEELEKRHTRGKIVLAP